MVVARPTRGDPLISKIQLLSLLALSSPACRADVDQKR